MNADVKNCRYGSKMSKALSVSTSGTSHLNATDEARTYLIYHVVHG